MGRFLYLMFIGTVAGVASSFLPRLMTTLAAGTAAGADAMPDYLSSGFVTVAGCFSVLIGLVTAILYHSQETEIDSRQVFFYSLGIPALISGALSTVAGDNALKLQSVAHKAVLESINSAKGVDVLGAGPGFEREDAATDFAWRLIAPAHAQTPPAAPAPAPPPAPTAPAGAPTGWADFVKSLPAKKAAGWSFDPSIQQPSDRYLVVLARGSDKAQIEIGFAKIRERFPDARLVLRDGQFLVLRDADPIDFGKATLDAARLQQSPVLAGQNPALIRLPPELRAR